MTVGVIGAGTMGSGIAIAFANGGYSVIVVDADAGALQRCVQFVDQNYASLLAKGRLDRAEIDIRTARIAYVPDFSAVARCELVVEAVYESLDLKRTLFAQLGSVCPSDAILATNTSTLDVDAIAAAATHPERCLGLHFFSPAHVMKLVEVVRGAHTSLRTLGMVSDIARAIGKTPVVVANADGFVGNRMLLGYRREAEFLVLAGVEPREVDAALVQFGFAMGPFAVADLAGIDIGVRAKRERMQRGQAPSFRLTDLSDRLVLAGRLGRKAGAGYYRYGPAADIEVDVELAAVIASERRRLRVAKRNVSAPEIVERCVLALVNEGARLLEAAVVDSAADIDTIWRLGYGFPASRGGPMAYAASLGYDRVLARIEAFEIDDAAFWSVAPFIRRWARAPDASRE